ncbi:MULTISPECIES: TIGR00266 family protein [Synechocystis]|uniref:TIGR00266 family protein n=1 Tax=Synechocystis salina LEGE 00031 TaxID=1828736 RepID=A0ABR9VV10_9SYNC|nr:MULTISPECIES: TIGR00266 family protein [Synechocystis]MBD2654808.1 TIGR00266 family protein [Synechocystis sp. FACHB-383]MBE9241424.1 TIGR00266 family protein [Synechocystis salina LEGE 00041]MBE9254733.1 TIGR00266 family protein [Synechocystis salina LEGE 00031]
MMEEESLEKLEQSLEQIDPEEDLEEDYTQHLFAHPREAGADSQGRPMDDEFNLPYSINGHALYATLELTIKPGQIVFVDANVVTTMDRYILFVNKLRGGLLDILRKALGTDALFLNQFTAEQNVGHLQLAPALPGDICHHFLTIEKGIYLRADNFLACQPTVKIDTNFASMKHFYNDSESFLLRLVGQGDLWFSLYGGLVEISIDGNLAYNPDYIVAFEDTLDYEMTKQEGLATDRLRGDVWGGKGRLCRFTGQGKIWLQARQANSFLNYIQSILLNLRFPRLN